MFNKRILELIAFLDSNTFDFEVVSRFLALKTFCELDVDTLDISWWNENNIPISKANFGVSEDHIKVVNSPSEVEFRDPRSDAIRRDKVIYFTTTAELLSHYPNFDPETLGAAEVSKYLFIPLSQAGSISITFKESIKGVPEENDFFMIVGSILCNFIHRANLEVQLRAARQERSPRQLTERQLRISEDIKKGKTNNVIALQMGCSVSLVRHETMKIYAALGVKGRSGLLVRS